MAKKSNKSWVVVVVIVIILAVIAYFYKDQIPFLQGDGYNQPATEQSGEQPSEQPAESDTTTQP